MTDKILSALMLLSYGAIEIPTKNETNTLKHIKFTPVSRFEIPAAGEQEAFNDKRINECEIVGMIQEDRYNFSCLHYALQKILGFEFEEEINFPGRLFSIFVEDYFEQTKNPQPNDLVIYTYDKNELMMTHFAVVINNEIVESKWGYSPEIRQHKLLDLPTTFGNTAWFYTLKKEYRGPKGKEKAVADILECINLQKQILIQHQRQSTDNSEIQQ